MESDDVMLSLAHLAGRTVVAVATTDTWATAKRSFAQLLSCTDAHPEAVAEQWLDQVHQRMTNTPTGQLEQVQARLSAIWQTRLLNLLEGRPEIAADVQTLLEHIQAQQSASTTSMVNPAITAVHR